jgi:transmembrane secretion effector
MVTIEYYVDAERCRFYQRRSTGMDTLADADGAYQWGILRDLENAERYLETFLVDSWAEHLRQHERSTRADRVVTEQVQKHTRGEPIVRHLVYETADTGERIADDDHRLTGA